MNFNVKPNACQVPLSNNIIRGIIRISSSVLYPEKAVSYFSRRDKPPNCKTVFVGGLPQFITEQLIKEIFSRCGQLEDIMVPEQGYCYVTFSDENSVDQALNFSGYRLQIEDKNEQPFTGVLFVDYALTEFNTNNSSNVTEEKTNIDHRNPPFHGFESQYAASSSTDSEENDSDAHFEPFCVCNRLHNEETFLQTVDIMQAWLEKEEFIDNNAASFLTIMHCFQKHMKQLHTMKIECEKNLKSKDAAFVERLQEIMHNLMIAEKVYSAGLLEQCSYHFTPAERENVEQWKKYNDEFKFDIKNKIAEFENKEETEVGKKNVQGLKQMSDDMKHLNEDLNVLQCGPNERSNMINITNSNHEQVNCVQSEAVDSSRIVEDEALFISLVSIYLQSNPGSDIRAVQTHLRKLGLHIEVETLERLMRRFSSVFHEEVAGMEPNPVKTWYFIALNI